MYIGAKGFDVKVKACTALDTVYKVFIFNKQQDTNISDSKNYSNEKKHLNRGFEDLSKSMSNFNKIKGNVNSANDLAKNLFKKIKEQYNNIKNINKNKDSFKNQPNKNNKRNKNKNMRSFIEMTNTVRSFLSTSEGIMMKNNYSNSNYNDKDFDSDDSDASDEKDVPAGSTSSNPLESCNQISSIIDSPKSGYYWIKPYCATNPLRVWCQFSDKHSVFDLHFLTKESLDKNPNLNDWNLYNPLEYQYRCASVGLKPIEIVSTIQFNLIKSLIKTITAQYDFNNIIPLGYDYSCSTESNKCSGNFSSLNSSTSIPLNTFEKINTGEDSEHFIGIVENFDEDLVQFNPKANNYIITHILCSTNSIKKAALKEPISVGCESTLSKFSSYDPGSIVLIDCAASCNDHKNLNVIGDMVYAQDSNICASAIHSNLLSTNGGTIKLYIHNYKDAVERNSVSNGIQSKSNNGRLDVKTFNFVRLESSCPIDQFKNRQANDELSEKQILSAISDSSKTSFIELGDYNDNELINKQNENNYFNNFNQNDLINKAYADDFRFKSDNSNSNNYNIKDIDNKTNHLVDAGIAAANAISSKFNQDLSNNLLGSSVANNIAASLASNYGNQYLNNSTKNIINNQAEMVANAAYNKELTHNLLENNYKAAAAAGAAEKYYAANAVDNAIAKANGLFRGDNNYLNHNHSESEHNILAQKYANELFNKNKKNNLYKGEEEQKDAYSNNNMQLSQNANNKNFEDLSADPNHPDRNGKFNYYKEAKKQSDMKRNFDNSAFNNPELSEKYEEEEEPPSTNCTPNTDNSKKYLENAFNIENNKMNYKAKLSINSDKEKLKKFGKENSWSKEGSLYSPKGLNTLNTNNDKNLFRLKGDINVQKKKKIAENNNIKNKKEKYKLSLQNYDKESPMKGLNKSKPPSSQFNTRLMAGFNMSNDNQSQNQNMLGGSLNFDSDNGLGARNSNNNQGSPSDNSNFNYDNSNKKNHNNKNYEVGKNGGNSYGLSLDFNINSNRNNPNIIPNNNITDENTSIVSEAINPNNKSSTFNSAYSPLKDRQKALVLSNSPTPNIGPVGACMDIKNKNYFNFEFIGDILITEKRGMAGVVFRKSNDFSYYALAISPEGGRKSIIKSKGGIVSNILTENDGGILLNSWHRIKIRAVANKINIEIKDLESNSQPVHMNFDDSEYVRGGICLFSTSMSNVGFDNISVKPIPCNKQWQPRKDIKVIPKTSNSFVDNFGGLISSKYAQKDSKYTGNVTTEWTMRSKTDKKNKNSEYGITQNKDVCDDQSNTPSILINKKQLFSNGVFKVKFISKTDKGTISLIFKYSLLKDITGSQTESYYCFDFNAYDRAENNTYVLRKYENNKFSNLKTYNVNDLPMSSPKDMIPGFKKDVKIKALVSVEDSILEFYVSWNDKDYVKIGSYNDSNPLKYGKIGVGTNCSSANFRHIEIGPHKTIQSPALVEEYLNSPSFEPLFTNEAQKIVNKYKFPGNNNNIDNVENSLENPNKDIFVSSLENNGNNLLLNPNQGNNHYTVVNALKDMSNSVIDGVNMNENNEDAGYRLDQALSGGSNYDVSDNANDTYTKIGANQSEFKRNNFSILTEHYRGKVKNTLDKSIIDLKCLEQDTAEEKSVYCTTNFPNESNQSCVVSYSFIKLY